jgi:hypothetical protein
MATQLRPPPDESEKKPERDPELAKLTKVVRWRAMNLLDLGFSIEQVLRLAHRPDVRADAIALLERGLPHDLVTEELID